MLHTAPIKRLVLAGLFVALCVVLPLAFHAVANAGPIFLPMHIPVLLCGLVCGWPYGLACGALGPILSSLITGMPVPAILPAMACELAVYGFVSGLMMKYVRTGRTFWDVTLALVCAMLAGRALNGALNALLWRAGDYSLSVWLTASFAQALPGIIIQLVLIPIFIVALERAKLVPRRYPAQG